jgi:hypothetical protein
MDQGSFSRMTGRAVEQRTAEIRRHPALATVAAELETIGARLGTEAERENDATTAQVLGHQLRNFLCALNLIEAAQSARLLDEGEIDRPELLPAQWVVRTPVGTGASERR